MMNKFDDVERNIGYVFKNKKLLEQALTHSSADAEHNYERLEFLGDSIVGYAVSRMIYDDFSFGEGDMTKLKAASVSSVPLAALSQKLGLIAAHHSNNVSLSVKVKSDFYEAVTAAIALDGGLSEALDFVCRTITLADLHNTSSVDYKSVFLEKCAQNNLKWEFPFTASGPDHNRSFEVSAVIEGVVYGKGRGKRIKDAEKEACLDALRNYFAYKS